MTRSRMLVLAGLMVAAGGAALLYTVDPAGSSLLPPCPFHALTGWHCPGCGSMRALHALLRGRVLAALDFNPLAMILLPAVAYGMAAEAVGAWRGRPPRRVPLPGWTGWALMALVLAYWVLRNVPVWPLTVLAP